MATMNNSATPAPESAACLVLSRPLTNHGPMVSAAPARKNTKSNICVPVSEGSYRPQTLFHFMPSLHSESQTPPVPRSSPNPASGHPAPDRRRQFPLQRSRTRRDSSESHRNIAPELRFAGRQSSARRADPSGLPAEVFVLPAS